MIRTKQELYFFQAASFLVIAPNAINFPLWLMGCLGLIMLWRVWLTYHEHKLPSKVVLRFLSIGMAVAVFLNFGSMVGRDTNIAIIVLMASLKLLELKRQRDYFLVIFLDFFLIITNFIYLQDIFITIVMGCALVMLMAMHVAVSDRVAMPSLRVRVAMSMKAVVCALPFALFLFIVFPRIEGGFSNHSDIVKESKTGISSSMTPGDVAKLTSSTDTAFVARFDKTAPSSENLYWRGIVLSRYDGKTWYENTMSDSAMRRSRPAVEYSGEETAYEVILEPHDHRWIFTLDAPKTVVTNVEQYRPAIYADLHAQSLVDISEPISYQVTSFMKYTLDRKAREEDLAPFLALPIGSEPKTVAWAKARRAEVSSTSEMVATVLQFFNKNAFSYTTEPPLLKNHRVDDFMFNKRAGFCEHYASAFVVIMRAAGIPARVVTGYQGGEFNLYADYLTVRQSDAHAWAEVWTEQRGWQRVDPTTAVNPARVNRRERSDESFSIFGNRVQLPVGIGGIVSHLQHSIKITNLRWNKLFLGYASNQQNRIRKIFGDSLAANTVISRIVVALLATIAIGFVWIAWKRHQQKDDIELLYQRFCKRLHRYKMSRNIHEGPMEYAARITPGMSSKWRVPFAEFMKIYAIARYGKQSESQADNARKMRKLLNRMRGNPT